MSIVTTGQLGCRRALCAITDCNLTTREHEWPPIPRKVHVKKFSNRKVANSKQRNKHIRHPLNISNRLGRKRFSSPVGMVSFTILLPLTYEALLNHEKTPTLNSILHGTPASTYVKLNHPFGAALLPCDRAYREKRACNQLPIFSTPLPKC